MKLATIVGARPQFVKAAALSRSIAKMNQSGLKIEDILIHTGQHYDFNMSDVFFEELGIPFPQYHLGIGGCSQGAMTGRMIEAIEVLLLKEKPDWVLVYGDTNSTLAGALAGVKLHIPVAHVEAGLRSFNRKMPEEINRIVADQCSDLLFTPTETATRQLRKEGMSDNKIRQVGDVMYDAALHYQVKSQNESHILEKLKILSKKYVLVTIHRAENTDDREALFEIFEGLINLSKEVKIVLPLHPRTKQALEKQGLYERVLRYIQVIDPVGYLDMISLESNAKIIITDSGGIQKEAFFFKVPCMTLRTETEWVELVEHGFNRLVTLKAEKIVENFKLEQTSELNWNMSLYGQGKATYDILEDLLNYKKKN